MMDRRAIRQRISRPLPSKFRRGLDALVLDYPGCDQDLITAREAIEMGSKKDFLKTFRILKGRQAAYEHYQEMGKSENWIDEELSYPGNENDRRELQTWFHDNPPNETNIKIFKERVEGLRNKNAAIHGDRSHPNIKALIKLKLCYPGCEEDVEEALQVHYTRPRTRFPDVLHSLQAKQDLYDNDRSHWRLVKLEDLELTYPKWQRDVDAVEDWHIHNAESRENDVLFHEIMEGILEKEALYLEWVQKRRLVRMKNERNSYQRGSIGRKSRNYRSMASNDDRDDHELVDLVDLDVETAKNYGRYTASFDKFYLDAREVLRQERERREPIFERLRQERETREPVFERKRYSHF